MPGVILPYQSGALGKGALGSMQLGVNYTPLSALTKTYELGDRIWIEIYDSTFTLSGIVGDYESLIWIENWYDFHTFEILINSDKINVSAFADEGLIRFEADGVERIGWIESIERELKPRGEETHKITGRGIEAIFAQFPCMKDTATGDGYNALGDTLISGITFTFAASTTVTASADCRAQVSAGYHLYNSTNDGADKAVKISSISSNGLTITLASAYGGTTGSGKAGSAIGLPGETALRTLVSDECITTSDPACVLSGLTLATDSKRGSVVARTVRFDKLSDVLYGIGKETGLSWKLAHPSTGMNFIFTVLQGSDVSSTVKLTTDYGNVRTMKYLESLLEFKNVIYVGGTGDGASRIVRKVFSGTTEPSGWARRATFYDATDCTTDAALDSKGAEILAELAETVTLEVEYLQTPNPTYVLGMHFKNGDFVTVDYVKAGVTVVSRITAIETTWERQGKTIKLTIGKTKPDFVSIYKYDQKANGAQKRR